MMPARGIARTISRRYLAPWHRHYAWCKLRTDPVYSAVAGALAHAPSRPLLDVGCGLGIAAAYLRLTGYHGALTGIDYDRPKILAARRDLGGWLERAEFRHGDMRELPDFRGHVLLLDILQFVPRSGRRSLLEAAAAMASESGSRVIIRSTVRERGARFALSRLGDLLARMTCWMKDAPVSYPARGEISAVFAEAEFTRRVADCSGGMPFSNMLFELVRK